MKRKAMVLVLTLMTVITFTACGNRLNGTYITDQVLGPSMVFDGDKVVIAAFGINAPGTYKIKDGQIEITYAMAGMEHTFKQPFSKSGDTITIGGLNFYKIKK